MINFLFFVLFGNVRTISFLLLMFNTQPVNYIPGNSPPVNRSTHPNSPGLPPRPTHAPPRPPPPSNLNIDFPDVPTNGPPPIPKRDASAGYGLSPNLVQESNQQPNQPPRNFETYVSTFN